MIDFVRTLRSCLEKDGSSLSVRSLRNSFTKEAKIFAIASETQSADGKEVSGTACDLTFSGACLRALSETFERKSFLSFREVSKSNISSFKSVSIQELERFSTRTSGHIPHHSDARVSAVRLATGEKVAFPLDYVGGFPSERAIWTTCGTACHQDLKSATQNAILETIERDIILRFWHSGDCIGSQSFYSSNSEFSESVEVARKYGYKCFLGYFTPARSPLHVAVVAFRRERASYPSLFLGIGTAMRKVDAVRKAMLEALMLFSFGYEQSRSKHSKIDELSLRAHTDACLIPENRELMDRFLFDITLDKNRSTGFLSRHSTFEELISEHYDFFVTPIYTPSEDSAPYVVNAFSCKAFPMYVGICETFPSDLVYLTREEIHPF